MLSINAAAADLPLEFMNRWSSTWNTSGAVFSCLRTLFTNSSFVPKTQVIWTSLSKLLLLFSVAGPLQSILSAFFLSTLLFSLTHLKVFAVPCFFLYKTLSNCVSAPANNYGCTVPSIIKQRFLCLSAFFNTLKSCYHVSLLNLLLQACLKGSNYHKPSFFQIFSPQKLHPTSTAEVGQSMHLDRLPVNLKQATAKKSEGWKTVYFASH